MIPFNQEMLPHGIVAMSSLQLINNEQHIPSVMTNKWLANSGKSPKSKAEKSSRSSTGKKSKVQILSQYAGGVAPIRSR